MAWFESVDDLVRGAGRLRRRRYGVIVMKDQWLSAIHLRPWPRIVTLTGSLWLGRKAEQRVLSDQCWLYYNQPRRFPDFLTIKYIVSGSRTTLRTLRGALVVLDEIARLKHTDATVCEIANRRISDRLLKRWGWEPHVPSSRRRHFIKRFYGDYQPPNEAYGLCRATAHLSHPPARERPSTLEGPAVPAVPIWPLDPLSDHWTPGSSAPPPLHERGTGDSTL